jgi:hypothetical protein
MRARYIAFAGMAYARQKIAAAAEDAGENKQENPFQYGNSLKAGQNPEDIFGKVALGEGYFDIGDWQTNNGEQNFHYGFESENRRINLNGLGNGRSGVLSQLLQLLGYDVLLSDQIAAAIADWLDADDNVSGEGLGAESAYYAGNGLPYRCKNGPFESVEELRLVKGVSPDIFKKIAPYLTVFPKEGDLKIDLDTAAGVVLEAVARQAVKAVPNTSYDDAHGVMLKALEYRQGEDGKPGTADDRPLVGEELRLNAREFTLWNAMIKYRSNGKEYLRVSVRGTDTQTRAIVRITAVVRSKDQTVMMWRRE